MYYGNYDPNGTYIGFYVKDIHGDNIPTSNIELSEAEWQEALTGNYKVIGGKHTYCDSELPAEGEIEDQKLAILDAEYQQQFAELSQALGIATLAENTNLTTSIKADYLTLKTEYDTKRGEVNGG
ncbi:hypothetical protein [Pelosinus baikalensis]|uniref:Uncharacterized protein n=1 Tax=Pelosinus baikalensis TaxID=2892015 RepID=A0ABS8HPE3_9FIRM|nr:hypothetical protein [Pelosinus baikalensis]MCC5464802.1 hypothetical protein [Pelosinus baikalensis]